MDNYKILNTKTNAIIKLLNELGYAWVPTTNDCEASLLKAHWILAESAGDICYSSTDSFYEQDSYKELSFNQLNDLVVLKRGDVKDATHTDGERKAFRDSDGKYHYWSFGKNEWFDAINIAYLVQYLMPINQDPALISGRDAWLADFDGKKVQFKNVGTRDDKWYPFESVNWDHEDLKSDSYQFRLKPQTIKLELEIPAPYKAKIGGRDDTSFVLNVGRHQYCYKTEDDYTKARDALEAVFDSAVRGTNS